MLRGSRAGRDRQLAEHRLCQAQLSVPALCPWDVPIPGVGSPTGYQHHRLG